MGKDLCPAAREMMFGKQDSVYIELYHKNSCFAGFGAIRSG